MALSGLDIYKLLPKTNCKACGFPTCLAFAMQLAKKAVSLEKCPHVDAKVKEMLEQASLPPIRPVCVGSGDERIELGNETVLFRHEEKFRNPCGIGFIVEDSLSDDQIKKKIEAVNALEFERVGQKLSATAVAVRQTKDAARFCEAVKLAAANTRKVLVLMSSDPAAIAEALAAVRERKPLVYGITADNAKAVIPVVKEAAAAAVVTGKDLDSVAELTQECVKAGLADIVIDTGAKAPAQKLWELTQCRRLALKKSFRPLGYPSVVVIEDKDPFAEALACSTFVLKYASLVLLSGTQNWEALSLLTLRQNIYTDPQKPLQIEPKIYAIGQANPSSPVLITTNFSLSYYTVVGEVEASKVPSYVMSVDTEGMSVLTAWAAEKFTPEKIADSLNKFGVSSLVKHKNIVIPGYVAVMSGDLEEQSGCKVIVGPKEAAGIPSFLKTLG